MALSWATEPDAATASLVAARLAGAKGAGLAGASGLASGAREASASAAHMLTTLRRGLPASVRCLRDRGHEP